MSDQPHPIRAEEIVVPVDGGLAWRSTAKDLSEVMRRVAGVLTHQYGGRKWSVAGYSDRDTEMRKASYALLKGPDGIEVVINVIGAIPGQKPGRSHLRIRLVDQPAPPMHELPVITASLSKEPRLIAGDIIRKLVEPAGECVAKFVEQQAMSPVDRVIHPETPVGECQDMAMLCDGIIVTDAEEGLVNLRLVCLTVEEARDMISVFRSLTKQNHPQA